MFYRFQLLATFVFSYGDLLLELSAALTYNITEWYGTLMAVPTPQMNLNEVLFIYLYKWWFAKQALSLSVKIWKYQHPLFEIMLGCHLLVSMMINLIVYKYISTAEGSDWIEIKLKMPFDSIYFGSITFNQYSSLSLDFVCVSHLPVVFYSYCYSLLKYVKTVSNIPHDCDQRTLRSVLRF